MALGSSNPTAPTTRPGSALVIATLMAALLAAAASTLIFSGRTSHAAFDEGRREQQARFGAESLIADALVDLDQGRDIPLNGTVFEPAVRSAVGTVSAQAASGLVDINASDVPQLTAFLTGAGVNAQTAAILSD